NDPKNGTSADDKGKAKQPSLPDDSIKKLTAMVVAAALKDKIETASDSNRQSFLVESIDWFKEKTALIQKYAPAQYPELQKLMDKIEQESDSSDPAQAFQEASQSNSPESVTRMLAIASASSKDERDGYFSQTAMKAMGMDNVDLAVHIIEDN